MSTTKQKKAARKNLEKARAAGTKRKKRATSKGDQLSTADKNKLPEKVFAFPKQRKEPLNDAKHVRNAIARFDQVQGVTDAERAQAWKRIRKAAKRFDVDVEASGWRELMKGGKAGAAKGSTGKRSSGTKTGSKGSSGTGSAGKRSAPTKSGKKAAKKSATKKSAKRSAKTS